MNADKQKGFRPGSTLDWRKRLTSVTRYIDDLESCLARANVTIATQEHTIQELRKQKHNQYGRYCLDLPAKITIQAEGGFSF